MSVSSCCFLALLFAAFYLIPSLYIPPFRPCLASAHSVPHQSSADHFQETAGHPDNSHQPVTPPDNVQAATERIGDEAPEGKDVVKSWTAWAFQKASSFANAASKKAEEKMKMLAQLARQQISSLKDKSTSYVSGAAEKGAGKAKEMAEKAGEATKEEMQTMKEGSKQGVKETTEKVGEKLQQASEEEKEL